MIQYGPLEEAVDTLFFFFVPLATTLISVAILAGKPSMRIGYLYTFENLVIEYINHTSEYLSI